MYIKKKKFHINIYSKKACGKFTLEERSIQSLEIKPAFNVLLPAEKASHLKSLETSTPDLRVSKKDY